MSRRVLDDVLADLLLAALEEQIVLREVRVPKHMGGDKMFSASPLLRAR